MRNVKWNPKVQVPKRPRVVLVNRCFVKREDGKFLIIKRSPHDTNNAGKWEVPGGKVDVGQDLLDAQKREVLEETGLLVAVEQLFHSVTFVIGTGKYKGLLYLALFYITTLRDGDLALSEEHTDHAWVTHRQMMSYDLTLEVREAAILLKPHL